MLFKEYQPEHEHLLLAAIMLDNALYDEVEMLPTDFQISTNRHIFEAIHKVIDSGEEANLVTVSAVVDPGKVNTSYLSEISSKNFTTANAMFYADRIKAVAQRQELKKLAIKINEWISKADNDEVVYEIEKAIAEMPDRSIGQIVELKTQLNTYIEELEKRFKNHKKITGLPSGFQDLDSNMGGFRDGEFVVIGARPSIGKTTLAVNIAKNMYTEFGIPVGFFSLETNKTILLEKIMACQAGINSRSLQTGELKEYEFGHIMNAACLLSRATDFYIDDTPNIKLCALRNRSRMMYRRGVKIIFIDYLTLIAPSTQGIPRHEQVAEISRSLKGLARELNIPVVVLSQVRRESQGSMPTLADIRESGSIEQDADVILFMHREKGEEKTEIDVAKNRNWGIGSCTLMFDMQKSRFQACIKGTEYE